jgi:hypothetical protein
VLAALSDAVTDSQQTTKAALKETESGAGSSSVSAENGDVPTAMLSRSGRCALHAVPYMLLLVRKLVQRDSYIKSPITSSMTDLNDELGVFQMHVLLHKVLLSVGKALFPAFKCKLLRYLPSELQQEWIGIVGDLVCSLQVPLPPAVLTISPPGQLLNPAQSQVSPSILSCVCLCLFVCAYTCQNLQYLVPCIHRYLLLSLFTHHLLYPQTQRNIGAADFTPNAGPGSSAAGRTPVPADFTGQESSTEGQEGSTGLGTANPSSGTRNRLDPLFINGRKGVFLVLSCLLLCCVL